MTLTRALQILASVYTLEHTNGAFDVQVIADPYLAARVPMADFSEAWATVREHAGFGAGDASLPGRVIRDVVAQHYGITLNEIMGRTYRRAHALPRQIAMFICVDYAGLTTPLTARLFGDRDHSTAVHAVEKIRNLKATDPVFRAKLATIIRQCQEEADEAQARGKAFGAGAPVGGVAAVATQTAAG